MVALMRGPRKIEDFVGFSYWDRLRFQKWFDDRVSGNGLPVVMTDRAEPADQCRRGPQPGQVIDLPVTVLLAAIHAVLPRHELFARLIHRHPPPAPSTNPHPPSPVRPPAP